MPRYEVEKPWGLEEILEINDNYMMKRLTMNAGKQCSLQSHVNKVETFLLLSGIMEFELETADGRMVTLRPNVGDSFTIPKNVKHRMRAVSEIVYIECSTPHPDDVVRYADDFNRDVESSNPD
jgi:mannose-6-phosphate isomerase